MFSKTLMTWMLVVLAFATWRIAHMLVKELGPMNLFEKMRHRAGIRLDATGEPYALDPDAFLPSVLTCVYCTSVWVGLFFTVLGGISIHLSFWVAAPFAFSAVAVLLEIWSEKN